MKSMRGLLLRLLLGPLLLVLFASAALIYAVACASQWAQFDEHLIARARTFASLVIEEWPDADDPDRPVGLVLDYEGALDEKAIDILLLITAADGTILAQSPEWPKDLALPKNVDATSQPPVRSVTIGPGRAGRLAAVVAPARREEDALIPTDAPPPPQVVVHAILPSETVDDSLAALAAALIVGGGMAVGGTLLAVALGVSRGLGPVRRLTAELDRTEAGAVPALSQTEEYPAELRPILDALHALLSRMSEAMQRERRFTDAIAHELRTPIAELRSLTDIAERWPEPERLRRTITESRAVADEMESLMEALLATARSGAPFEPSAMAPIALLPLAREILASFPAEERRRAAVVLEGDESACWIGPRAAITAIVRNLLDNAREYTPGGGEVRVTARPNAAGAALSVENGPVLLQPDQVDRIFEPFWRAEAPGTDRTHRGLGLAIVSSLCESLGLRRESKLMEPGRLRITITS